MVASDEFQLDVAVKSWVVASLKLPMALNCCELPTRIPGPIGVNDNDFSSAVTFKLAVSLTDPSAAIILTWPPFNPEAKPPVLIVAFAVSDELQATLEVRFFVVPSL